MSVRAMSHNYYYVYYTNRSSIYNHQLTKRTKNGTRHGPYERKPSPKAPKKPPLRPILASKSTEIGSLRPSSVRRGW